MISDALPYLLFTIFISLILGIHFMVPNTLFEVCIYSVYAYVLFWRKMVYSLINLIMLISYHSISIFYRLY